MYNSFGKWWLILEPNGLKVGQHAALGFPDLTNTALRAVRFTYHGVNHQEAQRDAGEKFTFTCNCELIFIFDTTDFLICLIVSLVIALSHLSSLPGWSLC